MIVYIDGTTISVNCLVLASTFHAYLTHISGTNCGVKQLRYSRKLYKFMAHNVSNAPQEKDMEPNAEQPELNQYILVL